MGCINRIGAGRCRCCCCAALLLLLLLEIVAIVVVIVIVFVVADQFILEIAPQFRPFTFLMRFAVSYLSLQFLKLQLRVAVAVAVAAVAAAVAHSPASTQYTLRKCKQNM